MRLRLFALALVFVCGIGPPMASAAQSTTSVDVIRVDISPASRIATLHPLRAIGSTVDKEPAGSIPWLYSKRNIRAMLDAGLGWLSYRLFTELSDQDWHWNPTGRFSAGAQGYWTSSSSASSAPITDSFGYRLPRSGNTTDQGNNEGYSRLDDGDLHTFWKSDPYLTSAFTGDDDALHPQWVVVDLGAPSDVDAIRIHWANPYATHYRIEYWQGDDPMGDPSGGTWNVFPNGRVDRGHGGDVHLQLGNATTRAQYLRVLMTASSGTCVARGSTDKRDCVGYAIDELSIGRLGDKGRFADLMLHAACGGEMPGKQACGIRQTATYVSSVDPWHSAQNRVRNQEQPGLDLIARSGLTRGIGGMYPVAMLYSTPDNAVAEIRYLRARGYPISDVELGEEPDGQYTVPEDYGALYVQWAKALHQLDPSLKLGGPVFSGVNSELLTWPDDQGNISWLNRFIKYLASHRSLDELAFMSFEHYPFNGCEHGADLQRDLLQEPSIMKGIVNAWRSDGLPAATPMYVTEAGFSAVNYTQVPMQIEGALWQADYMASALSNGVSGVVYYQYEPVPLSQNKQCPSDWGNLTMFVADKRGDIRARDAQFYASQMIAQQWLEPGDGAHELFPASTNIWQGGYPLMTAYAVHRPDKTFSVMVVNKDTRAHDVRVEFTDAVAGKLRYFTGNVTRVTFGSQQYVWRQRGAQSGPDPHDGIRSDSNAARPLQAPGTNDASTRYEIPARSITVLIGTIAPLNRP